MKLRNLFSHILKQMVHSKLTLEQACRHFIKGLAKRVGTSGRPLAKGTINQYASTVNIVFDFLYLQPGACRTACGMDRKFYNNFVSWLNSRGTAANTVGKHIKNLKAILRAELSPKEAQQCEFLQRGTCPRPEEQIDNIYLTEEEIMRIKELKLSGTAANVRDTFVLLCYTGCRYSDLGNITAANIVSLNNGRAVVFNQKKTGREVVIPLLPVAEAILMENDWSVPNQVSIQTFNRIIKCVCRVAGITEKTAVRRTQGGKTTFRRMGKCDLVSAHTARRSFATNLYKRGLPIAMIMSVTGHETERAFRTYIKITRYENAEMMLEKLK